MREPYVAGQFYEGSKDRLLDQIKDSFNSKLGASLPKEKGNEFVKANHSTRIFK